MTDEVAQGVENQKPRIPRWITSITGGDDSAAAVSNALYSDLPEFVNKLIGVSDPHISDYAAAEPEFAAVLLGIASVVARGLVKAEVVFVDPGDTLAVTVLEDGVVQVAIPVLPEAAAT